MMLSDWSSSDDGSLSLDLLQVLLLQINDKRLHLLHLVGYGLDEVGSWQLLHISLHGSVRFQRGKRKDLLLGSCLDLGIMLARGASFRGDVSSRLG